MEQSKTQADFLMESRREAALGFHEQGSVSHSEPGKHGGKTATFLKKKGHGREILGLHWPDKDELMRAKRRLLQCVSL